MGTLVSDQLDTLYLCPCKLQMPEIVWLATDDDFNFIREDAQRRAQLQGEAAEAMWVVFAVNNPDLCPELWSLHGNYVATVLVVQTHMGCWVTKSNSTRPTLTNEVDVGTRNMQIWSYNRTLVSISGLLRPKKLNTDQADISRTLDRGDNWRAFLHIFPENEKLEQGVRLKTSRPTKNLSSIIEQRDGTRKREFYFQGDHFSRFFHENDKTFKFVYHWVRLKVKLEHGLLAVPLDRTVKKRKRSVSFATLYDPPGLPNVSPSPTTPPNRLPRRAFTSPNPMRQYPLLSPQSSFVMAGKSLPDEQRRWFKIIVDSFDEGVHLSALLKLGSRQKLYDYFNAFVAVSHMM